MPFKFCIIKCKQKKLKYYIFYLQKRGKMPRFEQKFIEELLSKINIVDIIGGYCQLNRRGGSYWACCPLPGHSERTPSFAVNEMGQFYKCFGCGRGGDAIKFIMEISLMKKK